MTVTVFEYLILFKCSVDYLLFYVSVLTWVLLSIESPLSLTVMHRALFIMKCEY